MTSISIRERIDASVERAMPGAEVTRLQMGTMRARWDGEDRDILSSFVVLAEDARGLKVCWQGVVRARHTEIGFVIGADVFWGHYGAAAETSYVERCDKLDRV